MGLASFVSGFDPKKLQAKIATDAEMNHDSKRFNQEIMGGGDILDYLGGEFAFSLGGLDSDIFDGWNVDKVDAYLSVQVATEEKGKELIDVLRKKIVDQFGSSEEIKTVTTFLAKPLIEDYAGKKIYYSEKIPVPFVGGISFAYTFVDDFFIIGLNRMTIKHVIDVAASGDQAKKKILDTNMLSSGTFL